jgi:cytosine/adenosine deaminase-related metal-dependent hydrolase
MERRARRPRRPRPRHGRDPRVGLDEEDTERLLSLGAGLVWCPTSNLKILGRTLDPRRRVDAGRLALGTDSRLSGSRDLLDELRAARDASDLTPS